MKILLIFEKDFPINKTKLSKFLDGVTTEIKFEIYNKDFSIDDGVITKPTTFNKIHPQIDKIETFDRAFCFTQKQYIDNYFIHEHKHLSIFSLYGWNYLTNLPISNGVVYLIVDYISLDINPTDFRHHETTGCITIFFGIREELMME